MFNMIKAQGKGDYLLVALSANLLYVAVYLAQVLVGKSVVFSTLFVPDGVVWLEQIYLLFEENEFFKTIFGESVHRGNALLFSFYSVPLLIDITMVYVVNLIVINYIVLSQRFNDGIRLSYILYFFVPYFWLSFALPSKDIMVLLLTYFIIRNMLANRYLIAIFVSVLCIFVRDGYGVVATGFVFLYWFLDYYGLNKKYAVPVCLLVVALLVSVSDYLVREFYFVARNLNVAREVSNYSITSDINSYLSYVIRVFGNLTNLAFRPQFYNLHGGIDVLSTFYWLSGVSLLLMYVLSVYYFLFKKLSAYLEISVVFMLVMLIMISFNPMIQPRYLFSTAIVWPYILGRFSLGFIAAAYSAVALISIFSYMIYEKLSMGRQVIVPFDSSVFKYFY